MADPALCPECGTELPPDAPAGLCPACLLRQGLASAPSDAADARTVLQSGFVPPTVEELAPLFPQLEVVQLLGKGGMGAVYKARQRQLDRHVAVKILPPEIGRDPAFAERFAREARALAHLHHQNIIGIHDFGQAGGLYYFIMEYVDGTDLRALIHRGGLTPEQALAIVPQICEALQFAHDEGIVHRDIKPENILVDKRGRVKIADFGLAKLLGKAPADVTLTHTQQVMGTLHYMAPEQMAGARAIDHRADIYSLGVVIYEMLTGELPVGRFELPSRKVHVDVRLDEIVLRTLEREPARRYQHASEIKSEVETICGLSAPARQRIFGREFRSKATLFGWPLVHISFGLDPVTGRKRVAKGVIAIGDTAIGLFAIGGAAYGGVTFGGLAAGLVSFGGLALGLLFAFGGMALGGLSFGGMAVGVISLGGMAVGLYAFGGSAWGLHVLASNAKDSEAVRFFGSWALDWSRWLAVSGILFPALWGVVFVVVWFAFRAQERAARRAADPPPAAEAALQDVRGPAIGLVITGVLNWIAIPPVVLYAFAAQTHIPKAALAALGLSALVASGLILFGAIKMLRLESRPAAIAASLLAMVVIPGNLIGLPIGIWSLAALTSPRTKAGFNAHAAGDP